MKKIVSFFKTEISEKDFEKLYKRRIYAKKELDFLTSFYTKKGDKLTWKKTPDKKELKHLKKLKKDIKKNKGFVNRFKLIAIGVLIGGIVLFNLVFLDSLVAQATKSSLQSVFDAKVDVQGANLDLFALELGFKRIVVADKSKPFFNLFEIEDIKADLVSASLFRGNINIKTLQVSNILWGTPREDSGSLVEPKKSQDEGASQAAEETDDKEDSSSFQVDLSKVDVESLVKDQWDQLSTPVYAEEIQKEMNTLQEDLETQWDDFSSRAESLQSSVRGLKIPSVSSAADIPKLEAFLEEANKVKSQAEGLKAEGQTLYRDTQTKINKYKNYPGEISKKTDEDLQYLQNLIQIPEAGDSSLVSVIVESLWGSKGVSYLDYALKGVELAKSLKNDEEPKKESPQGNRFSGRDLFQEVLEEPRFLLQNLEISVQDKAYEGSLRNFSSHPDLVEGPAQFQYRQTTGTPLAIVGILDLREESKTPLDTSFELSSLPMDLSSMSKVLGLQDLHGKGDIQGILKVGLEENAYGNASMILGELDYQYQGGNTLGELTKELLDREKSIAAQVGYENTGGTWKFNASTDLDKKLADLAGDLISEKVDSAKADLKNALVEELGLSVEGVDEAFEDLEEIMGDALVGRNLSRSLNNTTNKKIEQAKEKITSLGEEALDKVEDQAKDLLDGAKDKLPSLPF